MLDVVGELGAAQVVLIPSHIGRPVGALSFVQLTGDGAPAGQRLEAAPLVASAPDVAGVVDDDMADLPRGARAATVQLAVDDDAAPDSGADDDAEHIAVTARDALPRLTENAQVGIVFE